MLENFVKIADMPQEAIETYKEILPSAFIEFWRKYGIATAFDGYLRSINPVAFRDFVEDTFIIGKGAVPLFITAFGDIIAMTYYAGDSGTLYIIKYKDGYSQAILGGKHFFNLLSDEYFTNKYFELELYQNGVEKLGDLKYDECFGFVPLLALGGKKEASYLDRCGLVEHLLLINQLVGNVDNIKESFS